MAGPTAARLNRYVLDHASPVAPPPKVEVERLTARVSELAREGQQIADAVVAIRERLADADDLHRPHFAAQEANALAVLAEHVVARDAAEAALAAAQAQLPPEPEKSEARKPDA